jgi:hypothetical protein
VFLDILEPSLKYHPNIVRILTFYHDLVEGQFQVVSLTGAVAS